MTRFLALLLALVLGPAALATDIHWQKGGDEVVVRMQFENPTFERAGSRSGITIPGLRNTVEAGMPSVPVKLVKVALPPGTELDGAHLEASGRHHYAVDVATATGMVPLSWLQDPPKNRVAVEAPRIEGASYPASRLSVEIQRLHGVPIAFVTVHPVTVANDLASAEGIAEAEVHLHLRTTAAPAPLLQYRADEVVAAVDDPEIAAQYPRGAARIADGYDYLIISTANLISFSGANDLKAFQAALEARQIRSKVVDLATIDAGKDGRDTPEKIRNFIRAEYKGAGIKYVLLAGRGRTSGDGTIPARRLWSKIRAYLNGSWFDEEQQIPSDLYYANLDGSFNSNNNDKWGEPVDGDDGGDVDFLSEVSVGRAVLETTQELQNFVKKTTWVFNTTLAKNVLNLGEDLFPEMNLSGIDYLSQLMGSVTEHGFTTTGYGTDWTADALDDRVKVWAGREALAKVSDGGFSMVNHLGHSNTSYNMRLSSSFQLPAFANVNPIFYYTQGCLAGRFIEGSFVDKMVRHPAAAFAAIANTTYGLAPEDPAPNTTKTPGASHMLHRQFVHQIVSAPGVAVGRANALSKEAFLDLKAAQEMRWVHWATTLLGDPSLQLRF